MMATQSDAHREWHLNAGVPMGQPGCPQDACHPVYDEYDEEPPTVKCGNRAAHGGEPGYHYTAAGVKECYASTGRFGGQPPAPAPRRFSGVWHSTGPLAEQGHYEDFCPGEGQCPVMSMEAVSVQTAVQQMRANLDAEEERKRAEARARYAAWRTIPVGQGDYANYALEREGAVVFYQVQRPSKGQYAGKTYVKRHSGEGLAKMGWVESGEALDAIAADPMSAAVLYGRTASRCAICHRKLTDDKAKGPDGLTSVQRGIGPKCATKVG